MRKLMLTYLPLFLILLFAVACASDNQAVNADELADNSTNVGDGGTYSPSTDGSTNVCEKDEEGNCLDDTDVASIILSTQKLDFGLSELEYTECLTIDLPDGVSYEAEIDLDNTNSFDGESQFTVLNASGQYSAERVQGSGSVSVCYMRLTTGTHAGQVKLVLQTASSVYAYIISLKGETSEKLFTITSPTEGQIIDSRSGHNEGKDDAEGDYLVTVKGKLNLNLQSVFENGSTTEIYIDSDGVKYKTTFDADGNFSKQVGVPQVEGVYAITLSVSTIRNTAISKTVNVVVAGPPTLEIEVRDTSGNAIDTSSPTDVPYLIVGLRVPNLYASGSDESDMPVTLYDIKFNDEELTADTDIWYSADWWWCTEDGSGQEAKAYDNFDAQQTLCIALDNITNLSDGINTISAKAKNVLGEASAELTLIVDNDKPIITISEPKQNQLYAPGVTQITVSGQVKYFAPIASASLSSVPAIKDGEKGSYCQPTSEEDSSCPASSVKMWFNVSTDSDNYPIYIYPQYTGNYSTVTAEQASSYMQGESGGQGNCYTETTTTEDAEGNEQSVTNTMCDVPSAEFSFSLTVPSTSTHALVTLYTNVIELQAESVKGHRTIEVVTFQVGETSPQVSGAKMGEGSQKILTSSLTAGQLGIVDDNCSEQDDTNVCRAPVMLNVSEGIISRDSEEGKKVLAVVEHYLNENLSFADVANGWMYWPKNEAGEISLEEDFQKQYEEAGNARYDNFEELSLEDQKKFIHQGLHSNIMVTKFWALQRYLQVLRETTDTDCDERPDLCFFEREGDPETQYNVALDQCDGPITTAFVPLRDLQYLFKAKDADFDLSLIVSELDEWPTITDDVNYNDFVTGRWIVQSLDLKDNGFIDADVCLVPDDDNLNSAYEEKRCDADVSGASVPAFWGHFTSYNLVEKGLLGEQGYDVLGMSIPYSINDDTIPLIWSVGKIRLKFEDLDPGDDKDESVIQVTREKIGDVWSNKVNIINDAIKNYSQDIVSGNQLSTLFDASKMSAKTIQIESFDNCKSYYQNQHPGYFVPFGCDDVPDKNYPIVLELNSVAGQRVYSDMTASGQNSSFLGIIWWGVMETFKKMVGCMDEELVNPMISSQYKYPAWVWAGSTFSTDFEWEDFDFGANIENADLNIFDGGLTVRLPLSLGVDGVPLTKRIGWKGLASSLPVIKQTGQSTVSTYNQANISGHLRRSSKNKGLDDYPLVSATPQQSAFLGLSLNLEEIFNSAAYLIFKKGPMSLLDTFGIEDIEANNNWSVGVDKVILARFDICDLAGLIPSELPPSLFFATIQSSFSESTLHLDVILDKDYPVTLSLNPVEGLDNATEVQLGVTNLQIGVKELMAHKNEAGETEANVYEDPASQPELLRFRLDGVIRARLVYHKTQRQIHVYIPGYAEQNIHASVPSGHGGATYDDVNVVTDVLNGVVKALFKKMQKDINEDITYDDQDKATINVADANPTIIISLKGGDSANAGSLSLSNIDDFEIELKMDAAENATCGDDVAYYDGEQPETALPGKAIKPGSQPGMLGSDQPWKQKDDAEDTNNTALGGRVGLYQALPKDQCQFLYPGSLVQDDDGHWVKDEDPIRDILCDYGIKDISITPEIIFDNDEGYIHLSADLYFELESWITNENEE